MLKSYEKKPISQNKISIPTINVELSKYETNRVETNNQSSIINKTDSNTLELTSFIEETPHNNQINQHNYNILQKTGATVVVGTTTLISGGLSVLETVVDGMAWGWSGFFSLIGQKELSNTYKEFTKEELVDTANAALYDDGILKGINDASYLKYDNDVAKKIRNTSAFVGKAVLATAITVSTGGAGAAIVGGISGLGEGSEHVYQTKGTDTSILDEGAIILTGGTSALEWYGLGQMGSDGITVANNLKGTNTLNTIKSTNGKEILTKGKDFFKNTVNKNAIKSAVKDTLTDKWTYINSGSIVSTHASRWLTGEEEFNQENILKTGGELTTAFGINTVLRSLINYQNTKEIANDPIQNDLVAMKTPKKANMFKGKDKYGGNQSSYYDKLTKKFKSTSVKKELAEIEKVIKKYHPNYTKQEIASLALEIKNGGCKYVATSNIIFEQLGYDEQKFAELFGYSMLREDGSFNFDILTTDLYTAMATENELSTEFLIRGQRVKKYFATGEEAANNLLGANWHNEFDDEFVALTSNGWIMDGTDESGRIIFAKSEMYPDSKQITGNYSDLKNLIFEGDDSIVNIESLQNKLKENNYYFQKSVRSKYNTGYISDTDMESYLNGFFKNNDVNLTAHVESIRFDSNTVSNIYNYTNDGFSIMVSSGNSEVIPMTNGKFMGYSYTGGILAGSNSSGHAMTFRGIDGNGNIVVSSWGQLYTIDKNFAPHLEFRAIKILEGGTN